MKNLIQKSRLPPLLTTRGWPSASIPFSSNDFQARSIDTTFNIVNPLDLGWIWIHNSWALGDKVEHRRSRTHYRFTQRVIQKRHLKIFFSGEW
ncbi:MAG: hypothetical protein MK524_09580 [SAR202 cluster bacterium]|nr:hypothetical protein [SAR202 cluster bacterium]